MSEWISVKDMEKAYQEAFKASADLWDSSQIDVRFSEQDLSDFNSSRKKAIKEILDE